MPKSDNKIVLQKKCPFCPGGTWTIKHFNGSTACARYASCSCGGQFRANNNQGLFYGDALEPNTQPVQVETRTEQPSTQNTPTQEPATIKPEKEQDTKNVNYDPDEEFTWLPF